MPSRNPHHFTKWELATEECAIIVVLCVLFAATSLAASALLPIRVDIVQCGSRAELPAKCREDRRCCALLEQRGGATPVPVADDRSPYSNVAEPSASSRPNKALIRDE